MPRQCPPPQPPPLHRTGGARGLRRMHLPADCPPHSMSMFSGSVHALHETALHRGRDVLLLTRAPPDLKVRQRLLRMIPHSARLAWLTPGRSYGLSALGRPKYSLPCVPGALWSGKCSSRAWLESQAEGCRCRGWLSRVDLKCFKCIFITLRPTVPIQLSPRDSKEGSQSGSRDMVDAQIRLGAVHHREHDPTEDHSPTPAG